MIAKTITQWEQFKARNRNKDQIDTPNTCQHTCSPFWTSINMMGFELVTWTQMREMRVAYTFLLTVYLGERCWIAENKMSRDV